MDVMIRGFTEVMYVISNALLLPVLAAVLGCLAWVLYLLGGFLREWVGRTSARRLILQIVPRNGEQAQPEELWRHARTLPRSLTRGVFQDVESLPATASPARHQLTDLESSFADSLARLSFLTRVGPMLGLLGTLIPLGPALTALGSGDIQQLSSNLVVAFTATVVGLVVSCLAYGMGLVRRSWYSRDLDCLEFLLEQLWPEEHHAKET